MGVIGHLLIQCVKTARTKQNYLRSEPSPPSLLFLNSLDRRDWFSASDGGYSVSNDFSGKQVQNDGDEIVFAFQLVASMLLTWSLFRRMWL